MPAMLMMMAVQKVEKSFKIIEPAEDPDKNVDYKNDPSHIEEIGDTFNKTIETPETSDNQITSRASQLNKLKSP